MTSIALLASATARAAGQDTPKKDQTISKG